jgi:hypothetical protein
VCAEHIDASRGRSRWFWTVDDNDRNVGILTCFLPDPDDAERAFMIGARDADTYDVLSPQGDDNASARVTRDATGWHCSTHASASSWDCCLDIRLVVEATDGGNLPKEAVLIPVRTESETPQPDGPTEKT